MRRLAMSVLYLEALLVVFAIPVAIVTEHAAPTLVAMWAGVLIVADVVIARLLRHRWAYVAGTVVQLAVVAWGFVVPAMFFLGACFLALWFAALWLGATYPYKKPPPAVPAVLPRTPVVRVSDIPAEGARAEDAGTGDVPTRRSG